MSRICRDTTFLWNIRVKVTVAASVNPFVGEGLALHVPGCTAVSPRCCYFPATACAAPVIVE